MDEKLAKIFEQAKAIRPDDSFVARSRHAILSSPVRPSAWFIFRRSITENLTIGATLALASVFVFVLFGGMPWFAASPDAARREILSEAESLNFQIQLGEAQYFTTSADEVAAFLGELKKTDGPATPPVLPPALF